MDLGVVEKRLVVGRVQRHGRLPTARWLARKAADAWWSRNGQWCTEASSSASR
jgi:hypothetical protein